MIKAKAEYTREGMQIFYRTAARYVAPKFYTPMRVIYVLVGAVELVIGGYFATGLFNGEFDMTSLVIAVAGIYLGFRMFNTGVSYADTATRNTLKRIPPEGRRVFFDFEEGDELLLRNRERTINRPYSAFCSIYETKEYFLFYLDKRNGYILEKTGIENATPDQLREFLNSKCAQPVIQLNNI